MWLWIRHIIEIVIFSFLTILFLSWEFWLTTGIAYLFGFYVLNCVISLISKLFFAIAILLGRD